MEVEEGEPRRRSEGKVVVPNRVTGKGVSRKVGRSVELDDSRLSRASNRFGEGEISEAQ